MPSYVERLALCFHFDQKTSRPLNAVRKDELNIQIKTIPARKNNRFGWDIWLKNALGVIAERMWINPTKEPRIIWRV